MKEAEKLHNYFGLYCHVQVCAFEVLNISDDRGGPYASRRLPFYSERETYLGAAFAHSEKLWFLLQRWISKPA